MKKSVNLIFAILLVSILCLGFACNKKGESSSESESAEIQYFTYANGGITGLTAEGKQQETLTIPAEIDGKAITYISSGAFEDCLTLKTVIISDGITSISENAFSGCSALSSITFPLTLEVINDRAFSSCFSLKEITLPVSVSLIDENAFGDCFSLEKIIFNGSYTKWQTIDMHHDWSQNESLTLLVCDGVNYVFSNGTFVKMDISPAEPEN